MFQSDVRVLTLFSNEIVWSEIRILTRQETTDLQIEKGFLRADLESERFFVQS